MQWDAVQYLKFRGERLLPAVDLAKRIDVQAPERILDVGCGTGSSTAVLQSVFPEARILGIDNSEEMLQRARADLPACTFRLCDAGRELDGLGERYDVVFSNACLQWLPNQQAVLQSMFRLLKPGGVMAVQVPYNGREALFRIIDDAAADPKWDFNRLEIPFNAVLPPEEYYEILSGLTDDFSIWETVYYHRMASHGALLEWVKGTRLRPYLQALDEKARARFEDELLRRAAEAYPKQRSGEILFRFRRLFFTAKNCAKA